MNIFFKWIFRIKKNKAIFIESKKKHCHRFKNIDFPRIQKLSPSKSIMSDSSHLFNSSTHKI